MGALQCVHLHTHSELFSPDSRSKVKQLVKKSKALGQPAICLTEHGNFSSVIDLEEVCQEEEIKSIKGIELYWQDVFDPTKGSRRNHLTAIAKNDVGWTNLLTMHNWATVHQFYYQPTITFELLERYHEGIIILSGCRAGRIPQLINEHDDRVGEYIRRFRRIFGEDFYLEVQPTGNAVQHEINTVLMEYGAAFDIPLVMTSDAHYLNREDQDEHRKSQLYIGRKKKEENLADYTGKYLMSAGEMAEAWRAFMHCDGEQYIEETLRIAEKCQCTVSRPFVMPDLALSDRDQDEELREWATRGLKERMGIESDGILPQVYQERLERELRVFASRGFSSYILMCGHIMVYARKHGILGGLRGSGGGSLVLYALRCTIFDPVRFGASFERFFSEEKKLPDADFDFDDVQRKEIIAYVQSLYPGRTRKVGTISRMDTASLVKDVGALYGLHTIDQERMAKLINDLGDTDVTYEDILGDAKLQRMERDHAGLLKTFWYNWMGVRHLGEHAAAIHITTEPIDTVIPISRRVDNKTKEVHYMTSWPMDALGKSGIGLKGDFLGVETYRQIRECLLQIGLADFDLEWLDNENIYVEMRTGRTGPFFQFTKRKALSMLQEARVSNFEDVASLIALNRPGSLKAGSWDVFVKGGTSNPYLDPYTEYTRHAITYQEQWWQFCIAKGMGEKIAARVEYHAKKKRDEDQELRDIFISACLAHGIPRVEAEKLRDLSREYLFNRAHAVSYAILACVEVYLRLYYPKEWNFATLLTKGHADEKRPALEKGTVWAGMPVLPAHINGEVFHSKVYEQGTQEWVAIRRGLSHIEGIGEGVAKEIVEERKRSGYYTSVKDLEERFRDRRTVLNRSRLAVLQAAGALEFDPTALSVRDCAEQVKLLS